MYEEPVCEMCGGELVDCRREGHIVCIECGTIAQQWVCRDEVDYNRHSAVHHENNVDAGKERSKDHDTTKDRIRSYTDHAYLSAAICDTACSMVDSLPDGVKVRRPIDAWALIILASEALRSPLPIDVISSNAGMPASKMIAATDGFRGPLATFLPATASDAVSETLVEMNKVLADLFAPDDNEKKLRVRKDVLRMLDGGVSKDAGFMNARARTRARALVAAHLKSTGKLDSTATRVLQCSTGGVAKAMKRI